MADWSRGLVKLGLEDQDWGPTVFDSYDNLKKNWRGSKDCPTEDELNAAISQVDADEAKVKYKTDRAAEYPAIRDQLDDIYHNGIDKWKETIKAVKDKYPKP